MPIQITTGTPRKIKGLYSQMVCERANTEFLLQEPTNECVRAKKPAVPEKLSVNQI